jgi:threonine synthase
VKEATPREPPRDWADRYDDIVLPAGVRRISLGEGGTPVVAIGDVLLKCEHMNPTGSYKDRVAAVGISIGVARGCTGWIGTSSGNAGAAYAAYGARAGLAGRLFTVDGAPREKLAQVGAYGTEVCEVVGFGKDPDVEARVFAAVERLAAAKDLVLAITARAFNAASMAGIKTIAFEVVEQLGAPPPAVYVPTGGGGLVASLWDGFSQWQRLGFATEAPRLVAVQAAGCAPIHFAAQAGADVVTPIETCRSEISGLQLTNPPDGDAALAAVRASSGWTIAVDDAAALTAQRLLAERHGVFVEPAAATAYAGYLADPVPGAVVLMTGSGLKTLATIDQARVPRRLRVDDLEGRPSEHGR